MTPPQILPDSSLGQALTEYARKAEIIVEVGTGSGCGSTQCLVNGLSKHWLFTTIDADPDNIASIASVPRLWKEFGVVFLHGVLHRNIKPYSHPFSSDQIKEMYDREYNFAKFSSLVSPYNVEPSRIDLLFLDGGEWCSDGDFLCLWSRCQTIILDDINPAKAVKNCYAHAQLQLAGWRLARIEMDDRNGWSIWERV